MGETGGTNGGSAKGTGTWECGTLTGQLFAESSFTNNATTHTITLTATTAGATGYGITLPANITYATGTTASDGTSSGTDFTYWTGNADDTAAQLATSLASSINASTVDGLVTAATNGASLIITANTGGTAGKPNRMS